MPFKAYVLTSSDSGYAGEREDLSGPLAMDMLREAGWDVVGYALLPAALTLLLALYFFPEQGYEPLFDPYKLTEKLSSLGQNFTENLPEGGEVSEREHVALRNLGPKQQRKYTALTVTAEGELGEYLYLRGMAYEGFDGFPQEARKNRVNIMRRRFIVVAVYMQI